MSKKIVVVDDEPDILKVLVFRLKKSGHQILSAATATEALGLIRQEKPDLVLLDCCLPDMSGIELSRRLRADEAFKSMPIILMTAAIDNNIYKELEAASVNDCLKKPFDPEELLACVKKYL